MREPERYPIIFALNPKFIHRKMKAYDSVRKVRRNCVLWSILLFGIMLYCLYRCVTNEDMYERIHWASSAIFTTCGIVGNVWMYFFAMTPLYDLQEEQAKLERLEELDQQQARNRDLLEQVAELQRLYAKSVNLTAMEGKPV